MTLSGRDAYRDELTKIAEYNDHILCLEADLGGSNHKFEAQFSDRFFNMGIAEMTSIDMAAGLAEAGYIPFFSTFASFASLRSAESIKLAMGYMGKNIKIVAPYGGVSGGWFGTTHHSLEDIAIVRSFLNIKIACPYGEEDTRRVIREAALSPHPYYVRLSRNDAFESLERESDAAFSTIVNQRGTSKLCLISIGEQGTELCKKMEDMYPEVSHIHLCYVDHSSLKDVIDQLEGLGELFLVVEEHRLAGGTASLLSVLLPNKRVYSFDCGELWPLYGGNHKETLSHLKFDSENLEKRITNLLMTH
ncbi:transketolase [Salipaludibacillus sp. LMS25]|uniref:transketolase n=1 Tax=Salipaludibacillus sp. LMS25 TaxID=2924031 RepID=UPI0020D1188F|nr:transketolase [Salipaludibacillus sp. LMS25]UTR16516.1 transketolase [Salipaludibacillus sp. LMS25]